MKKTHILKLLVTKANPFYASEETVLATNPIDVLEKEKKWFHMSGNTTFLISLANSLCLFLTQTVLLSFSRAHRLLVCYTAVFRVERCVTTLKTAV